MIYDLSLKAAGLICGATLSLLGLIGLVRLDSSRALMQKFPRSRVIGALLLTLALIWSFWLLATMEMGEFSNFRKPLLIILPIAYGLVLRFADEFLAVRALGILFLLAAEPLLGAAFLRYEASRLVVTVLAYLIIVLGLIWVMMPYLLRDQIGWAARTPGRWRTLNGGSLILGIVLLGLALVRY